MRDTLLSGAAIFGISRTEARGLEPVAVLILEASYSALYDPLRPNCRARLANTAVGFFLGVGRFGVE